MTLALWLLLMDKEYPPHADTVALKHLHDDTAKCWISRGVGVHMCVCVCVWGGGGGGGRGIYIFHPSIIYQHNYQQQILIQNPWAKQQHPQHNAPPAEAPPASHCTDHGVSKTQHQSTSLSVLDTEYTHTYSYVRVVYHSSSKLRIPEHKSYCQSGGTVFMFQMQCRKWAHLLTFYFNTSRVWIWV